jgi:LysM repeat protein
MECSYCKNIFSSKSGLNTHQKTAKYCLSLRNILVEDYKCDSCRKVFSTLTNLNRHQKTCTVANNISDNLHIIDNLEKERDFLKQRLNEKDTKLNEKDIQLEEYKQTTRDLQNKLENIVLKAIERPFEEIYIDPIDSKNNNSECEIEEYKLSSLDIGDGYNIEHREEDGYINVTNLCKAVKKNISDWQYIKKTQAFLQALSASTGIPVDALLRLNKGVNEKAIWVHPHVALNIAQWISPIFDVKVSAWVYEAMMTGKVDISNTKTFKEIQKENKTLKDKYLKRRPRVEYKDKYVIYILTTRLMQKERRYIMGKATNLTNRLSTYNKSDEHRVVYYQGCGNEDTMSLVENMVFHHLHKYREQANRERFVLPENEEIKLFSKAIQKSIEYCKKF